MRSLPDTQPRARQRLSRLGAGTAALAVLLAGVAAGPANPAHAEPAGNWEHVGTLGKLGQPGFSIGAAVDPATGATYVADWTNDGFHKFNSAGEHQYLRGGAGIGEGEFDDPSGIAVDDFGNVYVADTYNNRIQKFDSNGNFITKWGTAGAGEGEFDTPKGVAVDNAGNVYVADTNNDRVQKFSGVGVFVDEWGSTGTENAHFQRAEGVAVTDDGNVFVTDRLNNRVQVFTNSGVFLRSWGSPGAYQGQFNDPSGIAADSQDNIYVADFGNHRIQKLSSTGTPITSWNVESPAGPAGIAVNETTGTAFVAAGQDVTTYRELTSAAFVAGLGDWGVVGKTYSSTLQASGIPAVSGYTITGGALPPGFTLAGDTVSGLTKKPGVYKVTLQAENTVTPAAQKEFTINIVKTRPVLKTKFSTKYPKVRKTNMVIKVRISTPNRVGLSRTGRVAVYAGKTKIKTVYVHSYDKGAVSFKMPKFKKKGKKAIVFRYAGNSQLKTAKKVVYIRVK